MRLASVGELVDSVSSWNPSRSPDAAFTYIDLSAVDNDTKRIVGAVSLAGAQAPSRARQIVAAGDVLVSTVRPNLNAVALVPAALDGAIASTGFTVLRPGKQLDGRFLFHWVRCPAFIDDMVRKATGASYPAVSDRIVKESPVPLPPLPEQRNVAAILDSADALRAKRRQVLAHLDAVVTGLFNEALTGADLRSKPLAEVAEVWDCPHSTPRWAAAGSICLRTPNLTRGGWNWDDTRYVDEAQFKARSKGGGAKPGDIILSREGTVGIAAIVQQGLEACMGQRLVQVRPDPAVLHPQWALEILLTALHPQRISQVMVGSTAQHLNVKDLRALAIPIAPMSVQLALAERAESLKSVRESAERAIAAHDELFASLQARAFSGRL